MVQPHLIVLDLDGTLLTDEKVISEKTKRTILKAKEAGHEVMIATGRPYRASKIYYHELGLHTPIVNFNGAFVHHPLDQNWHTVHKPIDLKVVQEVVESLNRDQFENLVAEVMDDVYVQYHDEKLLNIFSMGDPKVTTGALKDYLKDNPTSLLIQSNEKSVPIIRKYLADTKAELIDHRRWGDPFPVIEIVRHGLNKAIGLSHVAKKLDIPRDRIIAFGDEDNDLEMIDYAGVGVAMGNGIGQLKNIANEITTSNNEDGIAEVLIDRLHLSR